jgi:hypothetical protein
MKMIGFDRRIRLEWLDEAAFYYYKTRDTQACADHMYDYLADSMPGHRTRRNIITVMKRVWTEVPREIEPVRDRGLNHLVSCNYIGERLAIHWGMIMNVYPFFRDVVELIGDMFSMQDEITLAQIYRRTVESWGERPTVKHALNKLVGSLWQWGVLEKVKTGTYAARPKLSIGKTDQLWLLESLVRSSPEKEMPLISAITSAALFPFAINLFKENLLSCDNFELTRQGLNSDIITLT